LAASGLIGTACRSLQMTLCLETQFLGSRFWHAFRDAFGTLGQYTAEHKLIQISSLNLWRYMMKTKQIISIVMLFFALGGVLALLPTTVQAQTAVPISCLERLDYFYACQNSDWRPDGSQDRGIVAGKPVVVPAESASVVPGRLDYMYAYRMGDWLLDVETHAFDFCASRLELSNTCLNSWQLMR
jgi:hypothetical protein